MTPEDRDAGCRIVLSGGPGGGKTTAADLFQRELAERVILVPEAATLLFGGGFPRYPDVGASRAAQRAIYYTQRGLEDVQAAHYPGKILLCDRGTVDGAAYWPDDPAQSFFAAVGTTLEDELARYDAVIFFETAAGGGLPITANNPIRTETMDEAVRLDGRLHDLWSAHPRLTYVSHNPSFFKKITFGLVALESIVARIHHERRNDSQPAAGGASS